jgi:hypothetical protein
MLQAPPFRTKALVIVTRCVIHARENSFERIDAVLGACVCAAVQQILEQIERGRILMGPYSIVFPYTVGRIRRVLLRINPILVGVVRRAHSHKARHLQLILQRTSTTLATD